MNEGAPIFVAGLDHSGKTALRATLEAHPAIHIVRHVELWTRLRSWFAAGPQGRGRVVEALTSGTASRMQLDRESLLTAAAGGEFGGLVREIGRQLCAREGTSRWGLQEALLEFQAEQVFADMPDARILMLIRDPRTRCAEMRERDAIGRGGLAAEVAAWIASARAGTAAAARWPQRFRVIRHEALRSSPDSTLRGICDFIGEAYAPAMLEALPEPPAYDGLPDRDAAFVQAHAAPEMVAHGYPLAPLTGRAAMLPRRLADASRWQLGQLSWRRRTRHLRPSLAWE